MLDILLDKKGIFFDIGWTLAKPASGDWMMTRKFFEFISPITFQSIPIPVKVAAMKKAFAYLEKRHKLDTLEEEFTQFQEFYGILNRECGLKLEQDIIDQIAHDRTYNMDNYILYDNVKETVEYLHKTHKLGVISDTWPSIKLQMDEYGIEEYFDSVTYSFNLGVFKPDSRMYQHALEKIGLRAEETVFIDDNLENLKGAAKLGIHPILIAANSASDIDTEFTKIFSISELLG